MEHISKKVLIIGGGLGGLSAGIYSQMNGFESQIFDLHPQQLGGLLYSWQRKNYTIEGCIHHMTGTGPTSENYKMYKEIGAFQGPDRDLHFHDSLIKIDDFCQRYGKAPNGNDFSSIELFTDIEKLENSLFPMAESKQDLDKLRFYVDLVREAKRFRFFNFLTAMENNIQEKNVLGGLKAAIRNAKGCYKLMCRGGGMPLMEFAKDFTSPFLKNAFRYLQYDFPEIPLFVNATFVANLQYDLGTVIGGGNRLSKNLENRYKELGGKINYNCKVGKVLTKDIGKNKSIATGIELNNGKIIDGDVVVSCCDGFYTYNTLLNRNPEVSIPSKHNINPARDWTKFSTPKAIKYYDPKNHPQEIEMGFSVALGVKRLFPELPFLYTFFLPKNTTLDILGKSIDHIMLENFTFDKTLAPKGKTVLKVSFRSGFTEWKELRDTNIKEYNRKKQEIAEKVIDVLEMRFKGIKNDVEMIDVSTPATTFRYTNNFQGGQPYFTKDTMSSMIKENFMEIPNLLNFYHGGMWGRGSSGLNATALTGKNLVRKMCSDYNRPFKTHQ